MRRPAYQAFIGARVPATLPAMIDAAAEKTMQNSANYIRQALIERLQRDGFGIMPMSNEGGANGGDNQTHSRFG